MHDTAYQRVDVVVGGLPDRPFRTGAHAVPNCAFASTFETVIQQRCETMRTEHLKVVEARDATITHLTEQLKKYKRRCKEYACDNADLRSRRPRSAEKAASVVATQRRRHVREALRIAHPDKQANAIDYTALTQHLTSLLDLI